MQDTIVFFVEKPSIIEKVAPICRKKWPDSKLSFICTGYLGFYDFKYPRGLKYSDTPFIKDIDWKQSENIFQNLVFEYTNSYPLSIRKNLVLSDFIKKSNQIFLILENNPTSAFAIHQIFIENLGLNPLVVEYPLVILQNLNQKSLQEKFNNIKTTHDQSYKNLIRSAEAKRYFEYNFNVNSMIIFRKIFALIGIEGNNFILSKYSLLTLYVVLNDGIKNTNNILDKMRDWEGSGKYRDSYEVQNDIAKPQIGSPISRTQIIRDLTKIGLITEIDAAKFSFTLTSIGLRFLSYLHKDCYDPDLPFRLMEWEQTWPESKVKIDRYLNTFFSKQRRFTDKNILA